jgi:hypothetical protein
LISTITLGNFNSSHVLAQETQDVSTKEVELPHSTLLYVSDYISFIGEDDQGHVAFALDTNRGRDGESFQAEHFVVLHDAKQGWLNMEGNGQYDNPKKELLSVPDSKAFQFSGTPKTGWTIVSPLNHLTVSIAPIPIRISKFDNGGKFWMGSAPGILVWGERTLKGQVIYEFLLMPDFNRLTRTYWSLWNEFQGFYATVKGLGDLYLHSQQSELITPLVGKVNGFHTVKGETEHFQELQLKMVESSQGFGFYKWPKKWIANWSSPNGSGTVQLELSEFNRIANWFIGGFSMGIVRGEVTYKGQTYETYGLVELIM